MFVCVGAERRTEPWLTHETYQAGTAGRFLKTSIRARTFAGG